LLTIQAGIEWPRKYAASTGSRRAHDLRGADHRVGSAGTGRCR
jgi:hypothetical protein